MALERLASVIPARAGMGLWWFFAKRICTGAVLGPNNPEDRASIRLSIVDLDI